MRTSLQLCAACTTVLAVVSLSGCGTSIEVNTPGQADGPMISIGVAADEPGMSWYHDAIYSGFSIEVAQYVAKVLGYANKQIVFHEIPLQSSASMLDNGTVDLVVGAYAQGHEDQSEVLYAGSYLTASQELLIRNEESDEITSVEAMASRTVCTVNGSDAGEQLQAKVSSVKIEERDSYQQCVSSLLVGQSDAVAGPAPILDGLREQAGSQYVQVVDAPYANVTFSIGMRAGETKLAEQVNAAVQQMIDDGTWSEAAHTLQTSVGFTVDAKINPPHPAKNNS